MFSNPCLLFFLFFFLFFFGGGGGGGFLLPHEFFIFYTCLIPFPFNFYLLLLFFFFFPLVNGRNYRLYRNWRSKCNMFIYQSKQVKIKTENFEFCEIQVGHYFSHNIKTGSCKLNKVKAEMILISIMQSNDPFPFEISLNQILSNCRELRCLFWRDS